MFKLLEMFGQRGGSDAFGRRAVKNIGIRTDIGQTFAETGTHCDQETDIWNHELRTVSDEFEFSLVVRSTIF